MPVAWCSTTMFAPDHAYFFIWRHELPDGPRTLLTDAATTTGHYHDESAEQGKL